MFTTRNNTLRTYLILLISLLAIAPVMALEATVVVSGGSTETLPTSVSSALQDLADDAGLTLLGWTTAPITDGHRPATYYGLGASVTPDVTTTYYAFFAESADEGELIVRQTNTPADGDTVLLATISSGLCFVPENGSSTDRSLTDISAYYSASLLIMTHGRANTYTWIYDAQQDASFQLHSAANSTIHLNATSSKVKCSSSGNINFILSNGFLYCSGASRYLNLYLDNGDPYWRPKTTLPTSQTFAFYRKEHYIHFCTSIEAAASPCPNCFIFTP